MSAFELPRRSFLLGLGATIAAPAIVRPENIMKVKFFDPYYTRYLLDYQIVSDRMMLRIDRALFPLRMPLHANIISEKVALKLVFKEKLDLLLQPKNNEQKYLIMPIDAKQLIEAGHTFND